MPKKCSLIMLFALLVFAAVAQDRKDFTISAAMGWLGGPEYAKNTKGNFVAFDFDYALAKRHVLSVSFLSGGHNYLDQYYPPGTPGETYRADGTNAHANYNVFSVQYKYKFVNARRFSIAAGTGAGIMMHSKETPVITTNSTYHQTLGGVPDLVFPVRFESDYRISRHLAAGLIGGFYIQPDYPIVAWYVGPRLSYTIK